MEIMKPYLIDNQKHKPNPDPHQQINSKKEWMNIKECFCCD